MKPVLTIVSIAALLGGCQFDGSNSLALGDGGSPSKEPDAAVGIDASTNPDADTPPPTYAAYWSFDENVDDATGAHNGTLSGPAALTSGGQGYGGGEALQLLGDDARMDIANPRDFDFNSDFTWHAYIKTSDSSGAVFSRNPTGSAWNQGSKALFVRSDDVEWDTGWVSNPTTQVRVDDDEWHQLIVTFEASTDTLNIFVDPSVGDTIGSFSDTHDVNRFDEHTHLHNSGIAETSFSLGQANFSGGLSDLGTLVGLIDEAAIFDRALVGAELDLLISGGPSAL
jgi:hypothetical protein